MYTDGNQNFANIGTGLIGNPIQRVLVLDAETSSALASLLYEVAGGEQADKVSLAPNHRAALERLQATF